MEKSIDLLEKIRSEFDIKEVNITSYSPLALAYIGDGVYEIIIRTVIVTKYNSSVDKMHKLSSKYVKAVTQAEIVNLIKEDLSEKELAVYKRGRNTKTSSMAKNATMAQYRSATGLEALIGYLYLTGKTSRAIELVKKGIRKYHEK
jgi:ribonuclease-3 family protein